MFFSLFPEKNEVSDDMIMQIASLLVPRPQTRSRYEVPFRSDEYRSVSHSQRITNNNLHCNENDVIIFSTAQ